MKPGFLFIISFFAINLLFAEVKDHEPIVVVTADKGDWVYKIGEKVSFTVKITKDGQQVKVPKVKYQVGLERMTPSIVDSAELLSGILTIDGGTLKEPGFLRCIATVKIAGKTYKGLATAAFEPEKIKPTTVVPEDFHHFWDSLKTESSKLPLKAKVRMIEDKSTDKVKAYEVSIQNIDGSLIYGTLAVPEKPGKYPAILKVPGAGVRPYGPDIATAGKGFIVFKIGIHGVPVTMELDEYAKLANGRLKGYPYFNADNRDEYYFKRVIIGCLRSLDYIAGLPEFDGKNIGVTGGSQGGALTIITAALDKRVKYLASYFPGLADLTGPLHGRTGGWPHTLERVGRSKELIETSRYYDVVNFARQLTIPGMYTWGFNDETCPPTSIYAAYNSITAPKDVLIVKEAGHKYFPEQRRTLDSWIESKLLQRNNDY